MPKRTDIKTILIPGSGAIVIGQAAEFDYSGTQAVKALRKEGYRVVLVNSNPATIMTDPEIADATYIEPITVEAMEAIIVQEKPDALLPVIGGQTGLNMALALSENGVLEKYGVQLIGANLPAIKAAEDRLLFRETMLKAGIPIPKGGAAHSLAEAQELVKEIGYPLLVRASFALGGSGASWVYKPDELPEAVRKAIAESPIGQAWIEENLTGWKEYELEVMRDKADNFVVICTIENLDPMGIHTGDSITVAPAQTLTDREYQILRDMAHRVLTAVGVETGGSNVQFAVNPQNGRVVVIEMNPRVSRSSALASKATGFPIAKLAALVAAGYTLDEITNDITKQTKAAFEPSLDYVVVKIPRWAFEKFPGVDPILGPQMKSVGEVMALGSTFAEALNKAVQSLEIGVDSLNGKPAAGPETADILKIRPPTGSFPCTARLGRACRWKPSLNPVDMTCGSWQNYSKLPVWKKPFSQPGGRTRLSSHCCVKPNKLAWPTAISPGWPASNRRRSAQCACGTESCPPSSAWIPARRNLRRRRPICTAPTRWKTNPARAIKRRSSSSAAAPIVSARVLSLTIAAVRQPSPSLRWASRPSCTTATLRQSLRIMTLPTACTLSRSPWSMC